MEQNKLSEQEKHDFLDQITISDLKILQEIYIKYNINDLIKISKEEFILHDDIDADNVKEYLQN
jgi:reverse gyrase